MLKELTIENIAIVKRETVNFSGSFSVLTGETGAGKSIIIDSIGLIMGERASRELIRSGERRATITALFTNVPPHIKKEAEQFGISCSDDIVISRELSLDSSDSLSSTARIDGKPVSVSVLREISSRLLNLHSQHATQTLMNDENHILYLDGYADIQEKLAAYASVYEKALKGEREIAKLKKSDREKARVLEMLKFQINDIKSVSPKNGEEEALEELAKKIRNAEAISKQVRLVTRALYSNDKGLSAFDLVEKASAAIEALGDTLKQAPEFISDLADIQMKLEDIAETVKKECTVDIENPAAQLDKIETRLDAIQKLKRKYGETIAEILAFKDKAEAELHEIESSDEQIEDIKNELRQVYSELKTLADEITSVRESAAKKLEEQMTNELSALEMGKVQFKISINRLGSYSPLGIDGVTFLVSTNTGEPLLPISKIASGGELSRIMLAMKCALADKEMTPTLIFDEIDTGISGRISHKIGQKLRVVGKMCQVICVTHSPQIAALSNEHLLVSKHETSDGRTESCIRILERDERIKEISRIIGGAKITEKTITAATEMLDSAEKI